MCIALVLLEKQAFCVLLVTKPGGLKSNLTVKFDGPEHSEQLERPGGDGTNPGVSARAKITVPAPIQGAGVVLTVRPVAG